MRLIEILLKPEYSPIQFFSMKNPVMLACTIQFLWITAFTFVANKNDGWHLSLSIRVLWFEVGPSFDVWSATLPMRKVEG